MSETADKVKKIVVEHLGVEESKVTPEASFIDDLGADVGIDWHGHRDRGLGLANALAAIESGVTRVHATALGVGERAGNTAMDLLLVNLKLNGLIDNDLSKLGAYCTLAGEAVGLPIPANYPVFGKDAFEPSEYPYYWRVVETSDDYFDYYRNYHAFWKLYGINLPDEVLKKLYYKNALRVVKGLPQSGWPQ